MSKLIIYSEFIDNLPLEDRMELASMINNHVGGSEDE